jgi:hypothetical protein
VEPLAVCIRKFNRVARQLNERSRETFGFETRAERGLMLVLHRPIELTAQNRHSDCCNECPLLSVKRTSQIAAAMSACDPMYGPAVRSKKIRRAGVERSCINVSVLCLEH